MLYDFAQSADEWGERVELRFRAIELEVEAEELEADKIPEPYVIVSQTAYESTQTMIPTTRSWG